MVFIDTAGFDDEGELGMKRVEKTGLALEKTDIALLLFADEPDIEKIWLEKLKKANTPVIPIINKCDILTNADDIAGKIEKLTDIKPVRASAQDKKGVRDILEAITRAIPEDFKAATLTHGLCEKGDTVLLVMPQDIQAPKGRLILPQVQTLRELLDKKCIVMSCTTDMLEPTLKMLCLPPKLIITDSQVFASVYKQKPAESALTSFSVLMAGAKGDIREFITGASAIDSLTAKSRVLITEACTHAPLAEDIGREKLPRMLRAKVGEGLKIDIVSGTDFPSSLGDYELIIHCGACMFNRKYVLSRIEAAK
ncbi:MAG: [FeFe] hydrogenase H-cluster maturation GTPase HydF, partial [Eubacteriales bacterium]